MASSAAGATKRPNLGAKLLIIHPPCGKQILVRARYRYCPNCHVTVTEVDSPWAERLGYEMMPKVDIALADKASTN